MQHDSVLLYYDIIKQLFIYEFTRKHSSDTCVVLCKLSITFFLKRFLLNRLQGEAVNCDTTLTERKGQFNSLFSYRPRC